MSYAKVYSRAIKAMESPLIEVEVHLSAGLPGLSIVGLPETAVRESKDRVRAAILNAHFEFPAQRITINLAPADLPKQGGRYDLPIAIGILAASGQIKNNKLEEIELIGELSLTGLCRPVPGVIASVMAANRDRHVAVVPQSNQAEAALVEQAETLLAASLLEVCAFLNGDTQLSLAEAMEVPEPLKMQADFSDVKGHQRVKRALEVVASGGHHALMVGAPGSGKSMLASRLPSILPDLSAAEAIETAAVYSISEQGFDVADYKNRPFRHPHHTVSAVALVGGGSIPRPGEISLAHNGVLFLDELTEFSRHVLEVLREPLENRHITVSRANQKARFPASFQLIAAMNPCPCGYLGDQQKTCRCTPQQINHYRSKLSGPFLDRIDVQIEVPRLSSEEMQQPCQKQETSQSIKQRVAAARQRQFERQQKLNADLTTKEIDQYCVLDKQASDLLQQAMDKFALSARVYHRLLKLARTIADMSHAKNIDIVHITEALSYRFYDRQGYN